MAIAAHGRGIEYANTGEDAMKHTTTPRHPYDPAEHPDQPAPDASAINALANLVIAGQIVSASLNDGTYIALMQELRQRGYELDSHTEIEKQAAPWTFRVAPVASIPIEAL